MKRIVVFLAFALVSIQIHAQVKFGLRVGVNSTDVMPASIDVLSVDGVKDFGLSLKEAKYGIHAGAALSFQGERFFLQPEVYFNSTSADYELNSFGGTSNFVNEIRTEKFQNLDIPLLVGVKLGPLRLSAGPEAHVFLNSSSELLDINGYEQKFEEFSYSWLAGAGLELWNITLDARYEGNFTRYGDHITFFNRDYNFADKPNRWIFTLGFWF